MPDLAGLPTLHNTEGVSLSLQDGLICRKVHPKHIEHHIYDSPFAPSDAFTDGWWNEVPYNYGDGGTEFLSFNLGEFEVARAEIEFNKSPGNLYRVPKLAQRYIDLAFFEVAENSRRRGIGSAAVDAVVERYPGYGVLAYSEDADEFWASQGWVRFEHSRNPRNRPLFVRAHDGHRNRH